MADRIAKTSIEAIHWYKFGSHGGIMPVRERTSTNKANGVIIGARKATLWDGIKVAFYSKAEKAALQRARGEALITLIHAEKPAFRNGNTKATFIDSKGREHEVKHQDPLNISLSGNTEGDSTLLLGAVLHKLLKKGALPAVAETGEPTKESPNVRKDGKPLKIEWEYNPTTDTPIRRELNPILVRRTGAGANDWVIADSKSQANLGAKGWVPLREKVTFIDKSMPEAANIFVQTGKFSTIAMRPEERVPSDFPEKFTQYFESYDERGVLRVENAATAAGVYEPKQPRQWTLFERDAKDLKNGTAKYSSPSGKARPEFDIKVVRLEQTVRHPQNLILEHTNGSVAGGFTVWQVVKDARIRSADGKVAARWVKTTYDAKGEEVMPFKLNKDGTYSYETRELKHGSVLCGDPFVYLSAQDKNRYPKEAKVRFADKLDGVAFEVSNSTSDIQNAAAPRDEINVRRQADARLLTGKITAPNADKPTGYDKQYNTILSRGKELYREKIAHLKQGLEEGTGDALQDPLTISELESDLEKISRVLKDKKTLHQKKVEARYIKPKGLQLTLDEAIMKRLERELKAAGKLEYRVGPEGGKHMLKANIFNQGKDWRQAVVHSVSTARTVQIIQDLYDQQQAAGGPNLNNPHSQKILALFGRHDRALLNLNELGETAKIRYFQHARLTIMSEEITKVLAAQQAARARLDQVITQISGLTLDDVSLEPDEDGALGLDARNLKAMYRQLKLEIGEIEHAIAHSTVLIKEFDAAKEAHRKMVRIDRAVGSRDPAAWGVRWLANTQIIQDSARLQGFAVPLINTLENKIAGIEEKEGVDSDSSSQADLTADLEAARRAQGDLDSGLESGDAASDTYVDVPPAPGPALDPENPAYNVPKSRNPYDVPRGTPAPERKNTLDFEDFYTSIRSVGERVTPSATSPWEALYDARAREPEPDVEADGDYEDLDALAQKLANAPVVRQKVTTGATTVVVQAQVHDEYVPTAEDERAQIRERAATAALARAQQSAAIEIEPEPAVELDFEAIDDGAIALEPLDDEDDEPPVKSKPPLLPQLSMSRTLSAVSLLSLDTASALTENRATSDGTKIHTLLQ